MSSPDTAAPLVIVSTRRFAAPRGDVFAAFADPARLAVWFGPDGFTNTFDEFDLRPGGMWRFTMHAPDGAAYPNVSEFTEVAPPERIIYRHHKPAHEFTMEMTFADTGGATELTWRMSFDDAAGNEQFREFIAAANEQNFDRLAAHLAARC